MSGYPIVLEGSSLRAIVIGGGIVALRKIRALRESGAEVSVVARGVSEAIRGMAADDPMIRVSATDYERTHLVGAQIVIAATNDPAVNAAIVRDARSLGVLVNVVDAPETGDFVTPAVHRVGNVIVAVVTGGVPSAAARIRDEIGRRFDRRYADATDLLRGIRERTLAEGQDERWEAAREALTGPDFCALVETGELERRSVPWR